MPVVSVVTPFHRLTPYLRAAVASIRAQSLADWEMLLVDNGAGATPADLGAEATDPRLRWLTLEKGSGIARARNAGVATARGEFIAFLDHDDLAAPRRLERQVAHLRAHPRTGLVCSQVETIDAAGATVGRHFALLDARAQREFSRFTMPAPLSSYLARRELCLATPFRPEFDFAEDYDFLARAVEQVDADGIAEALTCYRTHAEQTTQQHWATQLFAASKVRLATARRRAGREENAASVTKLVPDGDLAAPLPTQTYRAFARACLAEGFGELAVYHARKLLSVDRRAWPEALGILAGAVRREPRSTAALLRLFATGPLRAYRLRPA